MSLLTDISVGIPIGIIYNVLCHKICEIINSSFEYREKIQRNLILTFVAGIFALVLAITVFNEHKKFKNRAIRIGLYIGSTLLLLHTLVYNWPVLENDTKLFIIITVLIGLIWYSYRIKIDEPTKRIVDDDGNQSKLLPVVYADYAEDFEDE